MPDRPSLPDLRSAYGKFDIPPDVRGIQLCRMKGDELLMCETVVFADGVSAVDTVLRRAEIAGPVGTVGDTGDWWADLMSDPWTRVDTIALSAEAWRSLKNHWMRCNYV